MKVKTGDTVKILAGKDKGKEGKVLSVLREEGKAIVDGCNIFKRHKKKSRGEKTGQIIDYAAPIDASNLKVLSSEKAKAKTSKK